jgi:GT2 family glycosyltransferase
MTSASPFRCLLIFVAYHPSETEVLRLQSCLALLPQDFGYAVIANDYRPGEAVDSLRKGAALFVLSKVNSGYGRAINQVVRTLTIQEKLPEFIGALNMDLAWAEGTFATLVDWLADHPDVSLAVPQLLDMEGRPQSLCKQHPTLLGLISRRFIPERLKPAWLRNYDGWYVMAGYDYSQVMDVPYLSGCCMLMKSSAFLAVGGFDESFFLYLEDADLTRRMALMGRTVHLPEASVSHYWGRGNHRSKRLTLVNFHSAWIYFRKWGIRLM